MSVSQVREIDTRSSSTLQGKLLKRVNAGRWEASVCRSEMHVESQYCTVWSSLSLPGLCSRGRAHGPGNARLHCVNVNLHVPRG